MLFCMSSSPLFASRCHICGANAALNPAQVYVVLELMTGGELFEKIAMDGPLPEAQGRRVFQQLLDGLAHCHAHGVCHRCDAALAPANNPALHSVSTRGFLQGGGSGITTVHVPFPVCTAVRNGARLRV